MTIKNISKMIPLFIILSITSTFSYSHPLGNVTTELEKTKNIPQRIGICKDYPLCKEIPLQDKRKEK